MHKADPHLNQQMVASSLPLSTDASTMDRLMPVGGIVLAGQEIQTVNARDLHAFLEIGRDFSNWIKSQIERARLVEGRDFIKEINIAKNGELENQVLSGKQRIDYFLTTEAAKHIGMMCNADKGSQIREYFLGCERQAKAFAPAGTLIVDLSDTGPKGRLAMRGFLDALDAKDAELTHTKALAITYQAEAETATAKVVELEGVSQKHEALKSILRDVKHEDGTVTERLSTVRDAAAVLGVMETFLWKLLRDMDCDLGGGLHPLGWLKYENHKGTTSMNAPYAFAKSNGERVLGGYMARLLVECKRHPHSDGSSRFEWQTFFTLDGLIRMKEICDAIPEGVKNRAAVEQRQKNERRRMKEESKAAKAKAQEVTEPNPDTRH